MGLTLADLHFVSAALWISLFAFPYGAQLPPTETLSVRDEREFTKELERLEKLLSTAGDKPAIELQIANTYAAGGKYPEAIKRLRKLVEADFGFDPSRDPDFARIRDTAEFRLITDAVRRQTPPIHNSRRIATLHARDVRPESIAFDIRRNSFLLGNTAGSELVRCSLQGNCNSFVGPNSKENSYSLGIKVDSTGAAVWVTNNEASAAGLRCYNLESGKLQRAASLEGKHVFNDLAISSTGTVYVSDTADCAVYQLPSGTTTLQKVAPRHSFRAANGIAISFDERLLYVSTWDDGIDVIDLQSGAVMPLAHPDDISLAFIDGLYATERILIAIQNGPMLPRIVEFRLADKGRQIASMGVLERRNQAFDGITTGVLVRNNFYYVANPQTDKNSGAEIKPLEVFRLRVTP